MKKNRFLATLAVAAASVTLGILPSSAEAQQRRGQQQQLPDSLNVTLPASEGMIQLSAQMPDEVRVSGEFDYTVTVKNITDNIVLHDIRIEQQNSGPFEVESARVEGQQQSKRGQKSQDKGNQGKANKNQKDRSQKNSSGDFFDDSKKNKKNADSKQSNDDDDSAFGLGFFDAEGQSGNSQSSGNQQKSLGTNNWTIGKLMPGESKTIHVKAAADKVGQLKTCLTVTSVRPALCLMTQVVKADLQIAKRAPKEAHLCEVIDLEYLVQNDGKADLAAFTVKDQLPEGMRTVTGEKSLSFKVDGLKGGETRKFVAEVVATRPGEFSSRAVAVPQKQDKVRSAKTSTKVIAPELAMSIDGPSTSYVGRTATHTVRVTNVGNATANDVKLMLGVRDQLQLAHVGNPRMSQEQVSAGSGSGGTPTLASNQGNKSQRGQKKDGREQRARPQLEELQNQEIDLGSLEPGATLAIDFTTESDDAGQFPYVANAQFYCGEGEQQEKVVATARTQTEFIALSALLVTVVDDRDPIASGNDVTYTITVKNQGDAADENVQVTAMLPSQLKFVDASGPTKGNSQGNRVQFDPIKKLGAGESVRWQLDTKATGEGEIRLEVELTSNDLSRPAKTEEPTQLFKQN